MRKQGGIWLESPLEVKDTLGFRWKLSESGAAWPKSNRCERSVRKKYYKDVLEKNRKLLSVKHALRAQDSVHLYESESLVSPDGSLNLRFFRAA